MIKIDRIVCSVFAAFLVAGCMGQGTSPRDPQNPQPKATYVKDYQACMRCKFAKGNAPGKCSNCQAMKVAIRGKVVRVCPKDQAVFPTSLTKCATHKLALAAKVLTYYCAADKSSSSQSGNCSKCGKFRTKHLLVPGNY